VRKLWKILDIHFVAVRSAFERYEEKSYMRILKVEANAVPVAKVNH
jgi:hypothetical protein